MMRSRVTLAMTEAAAIERQSPSPPMTVRTGQGSRGALSPSTKAISGRMPSALTARTMARSEAWRMLMRSISATLAAPMPIRAQPRREDRHIEDHRRRHHRPRERTPPRLVDAADDAVAGDLEGKVGHGGDSVDSTGSDPMRLRVAGQGKSDRKTKPLDFGFMSGDLCAL